VHSPSLLVALEGLVVYFPKDAVSFLDLLICKMQVRTAEELIDAIANATTGAYKDSLCFIEVIVHKDDTSKELLEWGSRVSAANSRPPNPQ